MIKWVVVLHVMSGALWFGGQVYVEGLLASAGRTADPVTVMTILRRVAETSQRLFTAAGVLVLLTGIWIVIDRPAYRFEMLFVSIGFAIAIFGLALGQFYFKPKNDEIEAAIAEYGLTSDAAMNKAKQAGNIIHTGTLLMTVVLIVMVLKPGL